MSRSKRRAFATACSRAASFSGDRGVRSEKSDKRSRTLTTGCPSKITILVGDIGVDVLFDCDFGGVDTTASDVAAREDFGDVKIVLGGVLSVEPSPPAASALVDELALFLFSLGVVGGWETTSFLLLLCDDESMEERRGCDDDLPPVPWLDVVELLSPLSKLGVRGFRFAIAFSYLKRAKS